MTVEIKNFKLNKMKNIKFVLIMVIFLSFLIISCLKEDIVSNPQINSIKYYMENIEGKDSLITEIFAGNRIKIAVETNADIVSIWPGGSRTLQKKMHSTSDSLDLNGNPVLITSDWYGDYGLVGAIGYKTSLKEQTEEEYNEWYCYYTYTSEGQYDLTVVATNHGYDGYDLHRVIKELIITVE